MARELRDWGPSQCGQFASVAGLASMTGTLLTLHPSPRYTPLPCHPPFIRHAAHGAATEAARATHSRARLHRRLRLGQPRARACHYRHPRLWRHRARHVRRGTCLASAATPARTQAATPRTQAATSTPLRSLTAATYTQGKAQPVSARIVNLATEAGVPQGALAAERSTLNAIVKVTDRVGARARLGGSAGVRARLHAIVKVAAPSWSPRAREPACTRACMHASLHAREPACMRACVCGIMVSLTRCGIIVSGGLHCIM